MADMKLANWTAAATGQWPGVITNDKYIETITCGPGDGEFDNLTSANNASRQDCTLDNAFIRVFKIQPTAHKLTIQLFCTTALSGSRKIKLGVFGTIDETTNDALWARIPDQGIGSSIQQEPINQTAANKTNITYSPFSVLTANTEADVAKGEFYKVGAPADDDLSSTTNDLGFWPENFAAATGEGEYAQYCLNVDQLAYDYIAIRLSTDVINNIASGAFKFIVRQFN